MDAHPLSHGQRAIWFVQQLAPDSVVYNAQFTARVRSPLHRLHLRRAVQMLSARHELLRASFFAADGEPRQQIHETLPPDLTWRAFDGDDATLRATARAVVDRPFDLERGPAWRVSVLARGPEDYLLVIVAHHLIVDLAALSQLAEELAALYTASVQNVAPDLPPVEHRFAEYVAWHDHLLGTTDGARLRAYWSASLAGQPPALQLPTERARPAVQTYEGASVPLTLAAGTRGRVRELARCTEATPFMVLLAAYEALLGRYTAQTDFVVGSPVPGRRGDSRFGRVIGSFTNMMPLRADLRGDPSFSELLSRARAVVQGARDHQEYPFTSIIQDLALPRDPSRSPLFQTLFTLQRAPVEALSAFFVRVPVPVELQLSALVLEPFDVSQQEGQLDLAVELVELGGEYYGELKFNTALWSAPTAADAAAAYATLLDAALTSPDRPISALPLLAPARRAAIVALGTGAPSPAAIERGFSTLFADQAARTPAAIAVRDRDGALRYDELLARSQAIAGALQARGVKPGDLVAVAARRGCALIAAMLGVLWAGAAYVALDTDHPPARNAEILAQSGAVGVLAHESLLSVWTELAAAAPHRPWTCPIGEAEQHQGPSPTPASDPGALAYVVFTSGSTGTPKGAMVEQRGMVNHLLAKAADLSLGPTDIIAQNAPQSFVIANWQCLSGLLVGAEIHVIEPAAAADPEALLARVAEAGITILQIVPSLLRVVVEALEASQERRPLSLRWLVPTGEALPADLCRRWLALYPDIPLLNAYGCSECSDDVAHHRITTPADAGEGVAPLGRPVLGTTLFVLDDRGEPVPIGIEGDLWVGGAGVGRGYLGDPERTAAVFTSDPGTEASTARRYRTGDRARWRPGESLEYLGRTDQQVKVRGVRIELGEIEAVLRAHPALRDAAVIADRVDGDTRLVGFVVPRPGGEVAADAARAFVAERLPSAMVPAHIERIEVLPTNKHGKLDRRALAARAGELRPKAAPEAPAAGEAVEGEITAIWRELLRVPAVGRDDDFFALGGHSLLAVRLLVRLRERFGVQLPLTAIFELATVTKLAAAVATTKRPPPAAQTSLSWTPAPERLGEPFPLTELQQAYWLGQSSVVDGQMPAVAYLEHDLHDLDVARFERAWERLTARHPMLRAALRADGRLQVRPEVPAFRLRVIDVRNRPAAEVEDSLAVVREALAAAGPELERWPMLQMCAHRLTDHHHRLQVGFPLILGDLQSYRVLSRDLQRLYDDPEAALPPLSFSFRDHVEALQAMRQGPAYARARAYWTGRLATLPPGPDLPRARGVPASAALRRHARVLPVDAWQALRRRSQAAGLTPTAVVATAYAEALRCWSRDPQFSVTLLYQDRPPVHPEISDVVGNFSATVILEVDPTGASFETRAKALQSRLWQDLDHVQYNGVQVIRDLALHRGTAVTVPVVLASTLHLEAEAFDDAGLLGRPLSDRLRTPHVWIDHQVSQTREGLRFHWDILEEIFPPGLAAAMFATYADLLGRLARGEGWDESAPARLPEEQLAARREANLTEAQTPAMPLHGPVLAQAARTPAAMAVIAADRSLTYGELRARVLDLADELRRRGARPGQLVALCVERGWQAVVAALATLAAGAAYVPIDPALPDARRAHLLGRSEATLVLTTTAIDHRLTWPEGLVRICVEAPRPAAHGEANGHASAPNDLAYVIFTSGSTGEPKGVMIDHRGAVNTIADINSRFAVGPEDRVIGVSSLGFDLSVYDLFGPLAVGGALVVPAPERQREPGHWSDLMRSCRVTLWNSAPQMLQLLVDHAEQLGERFPDLRLAMMSGDWIPLDLPKRLWAVAPSVRAVSLGGATEASIWSIVYPIDQMDPAWASVPYGRPLQNQRFHVLDRDLMPRPVWVPGELYIGGIGVAQGYWRDPERTRASFITHPATCERLYRTGDLGRYFPDGNIEFLGRADTQVKIQGYRIELGEIEAHLGRHPAVQACAVVARGEARGEKRLVAYVVAGAEPAELQAHLAATLPGYMVPAQLIRLQAMPLSANGKVDRRALPDPAGALGAEASRAATPPRTATEATLATLWSNVLQTPVTDVHSDFFAELGGNSFAAVRLLSRVQSSLGRTVPLDVFLRGPTLAKLATHLGDISADVGWSPAVMLASGGRGTPLFLIHPIGGSVLCYRDLAANLAADRPVVGLQARGLIAGQRPWSSIAEMAGMYADAVERVAPSGPLLLGGWSMGGLVSLEVTRVLEGRGRKVEELLLLDSAIPGQIPKSPEAALLRWFARDLIRSAGVQGQPLVQMLSNLTGATRVADVLAAARRSGLLEGVTEAELEHLWQVFSAHQSAMERYMPGPVRAAASMIDASEGAKAERAAGWAPWTSALRRIVVPGDHYTMLAAAVRRDAVRDALEARWKVAG